MKTILILFGLVALVGLGAASPKKFVPPNAPSYRPVPKPNFASNRPQRYQRDLAYRPTDSSYYLRPPPQARVPVETLHNRLSPPMPQRPVHRFRRQALGGVLNSNPQGGVDARLELGKAIGTPDHNLIGKVFAAGNTEGKTPVTTGGALSYNNNGFGATLAKENVAGVRDTFTQSLNAQLLKTDKHSLTANAFTSQNQLANGLKFDRNGAGLDYSHMNGHGAGLTASNIPGLGSQLGLNAKANLWSSHDRNTRLDLTGQGSQWLSGPFQGQRNFGAGLGLTHYFG